MATVLLNLGVGNFSYWIDKLKDHYQKKTGMILFPRTLNVQLNTASL